MKYVTKMVLFSAVLFMLSGLAFAQVELAQRGINVSATGTAYGEPDIAVLELGVNVTNADVAAATEEVNTAMQRVQDALREAGITERDIQTVTFNIWREDPYAYGPEVDMREVQFRVMNIIRVTVRDVDRAGELLSTAINAGANVVHGITFNLSDPAELERQAREQAMQNARAKAEQLAELGGVALGPVQMVMEHENYGAVPPMYAERAAMDMGGGEVPVATGRLAVTVTLQVVFGIATE
jgi:uncharacterized protein YggE